MPPGHLPVCVRWGGSGGVLRNTRAYTAASNGDSQFPLSRAADGNPGLYKNQGSQVPLIPEHASPTKQGFRVSVISGFRVNRSLRAGDVLDTGTRLVSPRSPQQ